MLIEIKMKIPGSTKQQRKISGKKSYPTMGLRVARATWQAALEPHAPEEPAKKAVSLKLGFCYHHDKKEGLKTTRPDLDNLAKIVIDAMVTTGYLVNDAQIVSLCAEKKYTYGAEKIIFEIKEMEE